MEALEYNCIYLAGSFTGWREKFIDALADYDIVDPRKHNQSAIAKLVTMDMSAAMNTPTFLGHNMGTMSYAEVGGSRAKGNCMVVVDKNKNPFLEKVVSYYFESKEEAFDLLRKRPGYHPLDNAKFPAIEKKRDMKKCENILLLGDLSKLKNLRIKNKNILKKYNASNLENFSKDIDTLVVNFERGKRDKEAIFYMGLSYALEIPVIFSTANPIVYPPLAGLARRIFTGNEKEKILKDYLRQLDNQEIGYEAKIMYDLFQKYNS